MGRLLCCWELGAGFGHLFPFRALVDAGQWDCSSIQIVARSPEKAEQVFAGSRLEILPCPLHQPPSKSFPVSINYAQNLLRNGYWHLPTLKNNLNSWIRLFERLRPSYVLADHAPTAVLAARILGIPRGALGAGLALPPLQSPMPAMHPWLAVPKASLRQRDDECTEIINEAVQNWTGDRLGCLADLFRGTEIFLTSFRELDHYGPRVGVTYLGPLLSSEAEGAPEWPHGKGKRIFAYLRFHDRSFAGTVEALKACGAVTFAVVPDIPEEERFAFEDDSFHISRGPVNFVLAAAQCDVAVTNGGFNTANLVLLAGKPLLIVPTQLEQTLLAYQMATQNLAVMINWFNQTPDYSGKVSELISSKSLAACASAFAEKYRSYSSSDTADRISDQVSVVMGCSAERVSESLGD